MLCCRYALPLVTKRLESIKINQRPRNTVVCAAKGPRPRYPQIWKSRNRIGTVSKSAKLVTCVKQLSNVNEEVYGALDLFIAWELEFPLITVKKALKILQKEQEWKRIIQVIKWMLSKGQGRTMGTYFTLLNALAEDGRLEEAEELSQHTMLQEAWMMPFAFCTCEKRWCEFAEPVNGESTQFLQEFALKYNMVIISSILERDINHGGTLWNTAVIIGNHGNIIDSLEYCYFLFKLGTSMEPVAFVDCNC
ncbi:hypothetical protein GOBAR_DD02461 [Gossypium barbadense]|nr:hypothetical protein GOBAR_DD02461 [Gossypium barbadense]